MDFTQSQKDSAKFLAKIAPIYQKHFLRDEIYKEQFGDGYKALVCFLKNYAYERQGAAAAYSEIARRCISQRYGNGHNWRVPTQNDAQALWDDYKNIAKSDYNLRDNKTGKARVNEARNPMNMNGGIVAKLASEGIPNIAIYVRYSINVGKSAEAYNFFVKEVRGVGEKIASFYLRDIAYLARLDEAKISSDVYLLQPMDTWLEQTFRILFESGVPTNVSKKLQERQKLIVELCKKSEVSSIAFNQGAWVLGSQIAGEFGKLEEALTNRNRARKIIQDYINGKQGYLDVVRDVLNSL